MMAIRASFLDNVLRVLADMSWRKEVASNSREGPREIAASSQRATPTDTVG
jgi:hypothetical protein